MGLLVNKKSFFPNNKKDTLDNINASSNLIKSVVATFTLSEVLPANILLGQFPIYLIKFVSLFIGQNDNNLWCKYSENRIACMVISVLHIPMRINI